MGTQGPVSAAAEGEVAEGAGLTSAHTLCAAHTHPSATPRPQCVQIDSDHGAMAPPRKKGFAQPKRVLLGVVELSSVAAGGGKTALSESTAGAAAAAVLASAPAAPAR